MSNEKFDINNCTLQEAMDYSVKKIVEQGGRSVRGTLGEYCAYGDGQGRHCAIGWLLDRDDEELMGYEGDIFELCDEYKERIPPFILENIIPFSLLQNIHDSLSRSSRLSISETMLEERGIDMSGKHWQEWGDLVEGEQ